MAATNQHPPFDGFGAGICNQLIRFETEHRTMPEKPGNSLSRKAHSMPGQAVPD